MRSLLIIILLAGPAWAGGGVAPSVEVTDRSGIPLKVFKPGGEAYSVPVPLERVSPWLVLAQLAAEDRRFFTHPGVDGQAVLRALWQNASSGHVASGASTITQQLVRTLEPRPRGLGGKLAEMWKALRLERSRGKAEILEEYFNSVYYGNGCSGVEAASRTYFGVPAAALSPAQAAMLAGIPKSPLKYDPVKNPDNAAARMRVVLSKMSDYGYIDAVTLRFALAEKIKAKAPARGAGAQQFAQYVLARYKPSGGELRTTLDSRLQADVQDIISNQLSWLGETYHITNAAAVVLDNRSGEVLAWAGSADFSDVRAAGQVDGVTALRQPGSALKPFLYGLAFSRGARPSDLIDDEPYFSARGYTPLNYDKRYHGKVRLREALACSYNIPAVRLAEKTGVDPYLGTLKKFGFASLDKPASFYGSGLALGNGEVRLLELAGAYAALARGGVTLPLRFLRGGRPEGAAIRALDPRSAWLVTDILSDNAARAEAFGWNSPLALPFAFAAKTGTSKDYRDNWAAGYTPEWTAAVWVGNFDGSPMRKVSGITGAAPVLREIALRMRGYYGSGPFTRPGGIKTAEVCPVSGLLPNIFCPAVITEKYAAGNLPSEKCAAHAAPRSEAAPAAAQGIKFPKNGDVFVLNPHAPAGSQGLLFKAEGAGSWELDGKKLAPEGGQVWWELQPGRHRLSFSAAARPVHFTVLR